jgi:hypothetical protein
MSLLIIGVVIFLCSAFSLLTTTFPLSYSSSLLPLTYHADVKDMGAGSYEAATYLNSLPHARELTIWTDRGGVCKFFVGQCIDGLSFEKLKAYTFDYVVVSSARKNRTEKILDNPFRMANPHFIDFNIYYEKTNPDFFYPINNRPSQNIQVFPFTP